MPGTIPELITKLEAAELRARKRIADEIIAEQHRLIEAEATPSGAPQKKNAPAYAKRKSGKPPLVATGQLRDPSLWRVSVAKGAITIRPPASRSTAICVLEERGFKTLLGGLSEHLRQRAREILAEELSR
jgi:hypothetical protein